jgi:hypothetical protein
MQKKMDIPLSSLRDSYWRPEVIQPVAGCTSERRILPVLAFFFYS